MSEKRINYMATEVYKRKTKMPKGTSQFYGQPHISN